MLYGGAAGGGKSDLGLGLAGTRHRKTLYLRREIPQLTDVMARVPDIYGANQKSRGNASTKIINWDGIPRVLEFGSVPHEKDVRRWKGRPHGLKFFDELAEFTKFIFEFLIGWLRSVDPKEHCRVIGGCNPPTSVEGEWVIDYWAPWLDDKYSNPALPGELRWFAKIDDKDVECESRAPISWKGELHYPLSRSFIPAHLADNPFLAKGNYSRVLQNLPEPLRSQLLYGDWNAGKVDHVWQVIPTAWIEIAMERWQELHAKDWRPATPMTALGVDVARGGKAQTAIAPRWDWYVGELITHPGSDTPNGPVVAQYVVDVLNELASGDGPYINIDILGPGSSPYDLLDQLGFEIYPVNTGEGCEYRDRTGRLGMANLRAWSLWHLRELLDPDHGEPIALPPDRDLKADLAAPHWSLTARGILIEDKGDVAERLSRSVDKGDAVALAFLPPRGRKGLALVGDQREGLANYEADIRRLGPSKK